MEPTTTAALLGAVPSVVGSALSYFGAREANRVNREEAQKVRDFQQINSNTAHQRQMADMRAAGLNPILSANLGGASTPSGTTGSGNINELSNELSGLSGNAMQAVRVREEIKNMRAQRANTDAQTANVPLQGEVARTQAESNRMNSLKAQADAAYTKANTARTIQETGYIDSDKLRNWGIALGIGTNVLGKFLGLPGYALGAVGTAGAAVYNGVNRWNEDRGNDRYPSFHKGRE